MEKRCDICGVDLARHYINDHGEYTYFCEDCMLNYYGVKHYNPPSFACSECGDYCDKHNHYVDSGNRHFCCSYCAIEYYKKNS